MEWLYGISGAAATCPADEGSVAWKDTEGGIYRETAEAAVAPPVAVNGPATSWAERVDRVSQCRSRILMLTGRACWS